MRPLPSFPIELWQPVIVCLSGYYSGNLLTWMLADPKISFFYSVFFVLPPQLKSKTEQYGSWPGTRACKGWSWLEFFFWWMVEEELMTDFSCQFLDELSGNLIFSIHLLLWLRHSGKLKGQIQLTNRTWIPAKETYSPPVKSLKDQNKLLLWLTLVHPLTSPAPGHTESNPFRSYWEIMLNKQGTCLKLMKILVLMVTFFYYEKFWLCFLCTWASAQKCTVQLSVVSLLILPPRYYFISVFFHSSIKIGKTPEDLLSLNSNA